MASGLHLNLLKEHERLSSSPVRLRVLVPMMLLLTAVGMILWWIFLITQAAIVETQHRTAQNEIDAMKVAYRGAAATLADEQILAAEMAQIALYDHGVNHYADFFDALAKSISPKVQIFDLTIQAPHPYNLRPDPRKPALDGQKETTEPIRMRLAGRTREAAPVNALLKELQTPAYTNMVRNVEIPRGAFRQETTSRDKDSDMLLFEMNCDLAERRFE